MAIAKIAQLKRELRRNFSRKTRGVRMSSVVIERIAAHRIAVKLNIKQPKETITVNTITGVERPAVTPGAPKFNNKISAQRMQLTAIIQDA